MEIATFSPQLKSIGCCTSEYLNMVVSSRVPVSMSITIKIDYYIVIPVAMLEKYTSAIHMPLEISHNLTLIGFSSSLILAQ